MARADLCYPQLLRKRPHLHEYIQERTVLCHNAYGKCVGRSRKEVRETLATRQLIVV